MIFTKLHNKYSPSTHINKKCCYILQEVLILSFLSKSFLSFSILKMKKCSIKNIYINIFIYIFFIEEKKCFCF